MAPLNHRDPNLVGVALADSALIAGLIVDGVHVDPTVVKAAWNAKGQHGIALVTDAVAAMQQPAGTYEFAGREIISDETGVRYADGTLAGSALTMDAAVRLLIDFTGCETPHALTSATRTPTDLLGDQTRGRIEVDARADLVLLDKNLHVAATISGGQLAYVSDHASQRISDHLRRTEPAWKS
jgi:N-acetylglucosamine-6-phosphate deacetylase